MGRRVGRVEGLHPLTRSVASVCSLETEVLHALRCEFWDEEKPLRAVCVHEAGCLSLFMESGAAHYIPLPFPVSPRPLPSGCL